MSPDSWPRLMVIFHFFFVCGEKNLERGKKTQLILSRLVDVFI